MLPMVDSLITAIAQALSSILEKFGVVGRSRRRLAIRADLELLKELESFPGLAPGTFAYDALQKRIEHEVARLSGVDLRTSRRQIPWSSVVFAAILAGGLGYIAVRLGMDGHRWYALIPGIPALVLVLSILGMLTMKAEHEPGDAPASADSAAALPGEAVS